MSEFYHPEIVSALELEPTSQTTLRILRLLIDEKTKRDESPEIGRRGIGLDALMEGDDLSVWHTEDGVDYGPYPINSVYHRQRVGEYGSKLITFYDVHRDENRLSIEKSTKLFLEESEEYASPATSPKLHAKKRGGSEEWVKRIQEASSVEKDMGLHFVPEEETRGLIAFLTVLEPCQLPA